MKEKRTYFSLMLLGCSAIILIAVLASCALQNGAETKLHLILYAFEAEGEMLSGEMVKTDSAVILGRMVYSGTLAGKEIVLAESGVGMTNAAMTTQKLIDHYRPEAVIFTGIAGAVDSAVNIGDIVVCRQWRQHDYGYHGREGFQIAPIAIHDAQKDSIISATTFTADEDLIAAAQQASRSEIAFEKIGDRLPQIMIGSTGVSGNCFIDNREKRLWLSEKFEALVTDMESAAVGQVCTVNGIPFIVFRSASDLAGGSGSDTAEGELEEFFAVAADNSSKVVIKFLEEL